MRNYILNILIAIDQFINVLFGGYPDETISSRCGKKLEKKPCYLLCRFLHLFEKEHCEKSIEKDEGDLVSEDHKKLKKII